MKVLFVCLGNICRSPIADGIMHHLIAENNLNWEVDSAGTGGWHVGEPPDIHAQTTASKFNIDIGFGLGEGGDLYHKTSYETP